jgi:DNA polymerase delta subunit 1
VFTHIYKVHKNKQNQDTMQQRKISDLFTFRKPRPPPPPSSPSLGILSRRGLAPVPVNQPRHKASVVVPKASTKVADTTQYYQVSTATITTANASVYDKCGTDGKTNISSVNSSSVSKQSSHFTSTNDIDFETNFKVRAEDESHVLYSRPRSRPAATVATVATTASTTTTATTATSSTSVDATSTNSKRSKSISTAPHTSTTTVGGPGPNSNSPANCQRLNTVSSLAARAPLRHDSRAYHRTDSVSQHHAMRDMKTSYDVQSSYGPMSQVDIAWGSHVTPSMTPLSGSSGNSYAVNSIAAADSTSTILSRAGSDPSTITTSSDDPTLGDSIVHQRSMKRSHSSPGPVPLRSQAHETWKHRQVSKRRKLLELLSEMDGLCTPEASQESQSQYSQSHSNSHSHSRSDSHSLVQAIETQSTTVQTTRQLEDSHDPSPNPGDTVSNTDSAEFQHEPLATHVVAPPGFTVTRSFRPRCDAVDAKVHDLEFQIVDIDSKFTKPAGLTMRIFGVTHAGHSVLIHAHGFRPYLYFSIPTSWKLAHARQFSAKLASDLQGRYASPSARHAVPPRVTGFEIVHRKAICGFRTADTPFVRIYVNTPEAVSACSYLTTKRNSNSSDSTDKAAAPDMMQVCNMPFQPYESNVDAIMRFCIDHDISGANWLRIPAGKYHPRGFDRHSSTCQIEADAAASDVVSIPCDGKYSNIPPLIIASFDIECLGDGDRFPSAENPADEVIMIATSLQRHGEKQPFYRHLVCSKPCAPLKDTEIVCTPNEAELLMEWKRFMSAADPDIITGYNIFNFDLPYVFDRAKLHDLRKFPFLGRITREECIMQERTTSSRAHGTQKTVRYSMSGRIQIDLYKHIQLEHKLASYKLNAVAFHFLKDRKEDVPYFCIRPLFYGTNDERSKLAQYCVKDTLLPLQLLDRLMIVVNLTEMARVTGVLINALVTRGQQYKVFSQICKAARQRGCVIPTYRSGASDGSKGYQGATVIDALSGMYRGPICTLDFASLYPSIMIAHNLSYETLVPSSAIPSSVGLRDDQIAKFTDGAQISKFVRYNAECNDAKDPTSQRGLLPSVLINLLNARKQAKKLMKLESDPVLKSIYNGRQLALKISCNSIYGFCGAVAGFLPCIPIASTTTHIGRDLISRSKQIAESHYRIENGFKGNAKVVYGDTDSIMINFNLPNPRAPETVRDAMRLGEEAAELISNVFPNPILLEFEKVYRPYMLFSKKRYAGMLYSTAWDKPDYLDVKGLQNVRRDSCLLLRELYNDCLNMILREDDVPKAQQLVQTVVSQLLARSVSVHKLLLSKKLSKLEYKSKAPHAELVKRLIQRDALAAPKVGDRISYVVIEADRNASVADRAEDPLFAIENAQPLDVQWYISNQLQRPISELFSLVMADPEKLFRGAHTRQISRTFAARASIMKYFVKVSHRCLGCNCEIEHSVTKSSQRRTKAHNAAAQSENNQTTAAAAAADTVPSAAARTMSTEVKYSNAVSQWSDEALLEGCLVGTSSSDESTPLSQHALCSECESIGQSVAMIKGVELDRMRSSLAGIWSTCIGCAGSRDIALVCRNADCSVLYDRTSKQQVLRKLKNQVHELSKQQHGRLQAAGDMSW